MDEFTYIAELLDRGTDLSTAFRLASVYGELGQFSGPDVWDDNTADLAVAKSVGGASVSYVAVNGSSYKAPVMKTGSPTTILQAPFHIKHDVKRGSYIWPHVHWTTDGTNTGDVTWTIKYQLAAGHDQANFPTETTITIDQTASHTAAWRHFIAEGTDEDTQAIPMPEVDSLILCTLQLTSNTISTDNILGLYLDMHYLKDRYGTINKAPNFYSNAV